MKNNNNVPGAEDKYKEDRKYFHGEAAAGSLENAGSSFQSPSLIAEGATDREVAVVSSISNLFLSLLLVKVPSMLNSAAAVKRVVLLFGILNAVTWVPLIIVLFFMGKIAPVWLIALWVVCLLPGLLSEPLRDHWLSGKVAKANMGHYLSMRALISTVVYIIAVLLMGYFLDSKGAKIFQGYGIVLIVALAGSLAALYLYRRIKAPKSETADSGRVYFSFGDFLKETRRGHMGKFMLYVAMVNFGVNLCTAFFTVYMLKNLHFTYVSYIVVISAEYVARIVSVTFWGRMVDRTGSIRVMGIVSRFIPLIPVLWLFSHNLIYLVAIQLLSGTIWAAFDLSRQTFVYQGTPKDLRLHYIVYQRTLITFAVAAGALAGALVLNYVYPVFGSSILGLFLLSGFVRFLVVAGMFPGLSKQIKEENTIAEEQASPCRQAPVRVMPPVQAVSGTKWRPHGRHSVLTRETASTSGVYYHPEKWTKQKVPVTVTVLPPAGAANSRPVSGICPGGIQGKAFPRSSRRPGYYYRPDEWDGYRSMRNQKKGIVLEPDLRKPEPVKITAS